MDDDRGRRGRGRRGRRRGGARGGDALRALGLGLALVATGARAARRAGAFETTFETASTLADAFWTVATRAIERAWAPRTQSATVTPRDAFGAARATATAREVGEADAATARASV